MIKTTDRRFNIWIR